MADTTGKPGGAENTLTIPVMYSCRGCGLQRRLVQVPVREPDEDVVVWVEQRAAATIARDHAGISPACQATVLDELLIPTDGRSIIGGPTEN